MQSGCVSNLWNLTQWGLVMHICLGNGLLTHWGRVTHICVSNLTIIVSDKRLSAWSAPSHYLNQCWNIVNWTLRNKLQWNFNWNSNIFIQENALENVVCEMASILSRPQCVNSSPPVATYMCQWTVSALVQVMSYNLFVANPLPKPMLT